MYNEKLDHLIIIRTPDYLLRECLEDLEVQADSNTHNSHSHTQSSHSPIHHHLVRIPTQLLLTRRIHLITAHPLSNTSTTSPTHKQQHSSDGSSTSNKAVLYLILSTGEGTSPKYQEGLRLCQTGQSRRSKDKN